MNIKVGITGQAGFIGTHLYNLIGTKTNLERIPFEDEFFQDQEILQKFVAKCDVIVHLAAMNRAADENELYNTNINLVKKLIAALETKNSKTHIVFSSSIQETRDNPYGKSKYEGGLLFEKWARANQCKFTNLIIPNVFGPFGKPYYNSFIATFCHQINNKEIPTVAIDNQVKLIYVGTLCEEILDHCRSAEPIIRKVSCAPDFEMKVSEILQVLNNFKNEYLVSGIIPLLKNRNKINLFNTFVSFINYKKLYPRVYTQHSDNRGDFVEVLKTNIGGQVSFSTTKPGITRGNHYHTRKIERFSVIKGKALIELRRIGTTEKLSFEMDGEKPSYIDMPVWYTHNIKNVGKDELVTIFYINEFYNQENADTFFEVV